VNKGGEWTVWFVLLAALLLCRSAWAEPVSDIRNTKHNFSLSSAGSVKATAESQICVFCHTPHQAENIPAAPLWNRKMSGATYTPYTSNSIDANDIVATPGGSSKLCLSCHDGTVAIGAVNVLSGSADQTISMQGTDGLGAIPDGTGALTGYTRKLGVDLTNDHPISFTYDSALASADGELRDPAGASHIGSASDKVAVPLENGQVQCTSCHDPHIRDTDLAINRKFLRLNRFQESLPLGGSFNEAGDIICLACHEKLGQAWSDSAHASLTVADETYTPSAASDREFPANLPVWKASCLNCHDTHTVQGSRLLLREGTDSLVTPKSGGESAIEETCYQCHSSDGNVLQGQGGANFPVPDVKTDFTTGLTHMPITTQDQIASSEVHSVVNADLTEDVSRLGNSQRHVECTDCHNPHRVIKNSLFNGIGTTSAATHQHSSGHTNIASGALRGTVGVEPIYSAREFNPSNYPGLYTVKQGDGGQGAGTSETETHVTREYQICLRCHSDYAYGVTPPTLGDSGGGTTYNTNDLQQYTNQAMEFQAPLSHQGEVTTIDSGASSSYSTNNHRSWHPVIDKTGRSATTRNADANNWLTPWNGVADIGNQTMYCSDCHGSNTGIGTVEPNGGEDGNPWGPHGSINNFILKGDWDENTGTATSNDLCFKCHRYTKYATRGGGKSGFGGPKDENLHSYHADKIGKLNCTWCHTAVPHGWKNKAFLVNLNDVGPEVNVAEGTQVRNNTTAGYTNGPYYLNAMLKVRSFATSGNWDESNCGSSGTPGNGQSGRDWMRDSSENCANPP